MSKTRDTGYLANVIQVHDTGVRIMSGSTMLMAVSSSGEVTVTGVISGSNALSSSFSLNSALLSGTGSVGFATTGAFATASGSVSSRITQIEQVYATTGSNSFRATQSITGSLTVTGQIIAQTLNVQQVTSSIVYSSGSNVFGCDINSRQTFTGSFYQTGSVAIFKSAIGIGTAPDTNQSPLLHAYNSSAATRIRLEYYSGSAGAIDFYSGSTANWSIVVDNNQAYGKIENRFIAGDAIRFYNSTNNVILNATAGCVGIGTTCLTAAKLTIGGVTVSQTTAALDINASGTGAYLRGIRVLNCSMTADSGIMVQVGKSDDLLNAGQMTFNYCANSSTSNYLEFGLYACDRILNIVGTGRVGLGLINPDTQLHARSASQITAIKSESTHASGYGLFQSKNSTSGLWQTGAWPDNTYRIGLSGVADYFSINADGGVRVIGGSLAIRNSGNSITYGLMLRAGAWLGDATADLGISAETGYNIRFYTDGSATERLRLTTAGQLQSYVSMKVQSGTGGSSAGFIVRPSDNTDESTFFGKESYWTLIGANSNEGWKFRGSNGANAFLVNAGSFSYSATLLGSLTQNASDIRLKTNIAKIENALEKINTLEGFTYNWKEECPLYNPNNDSKEVGISAQAIKEVLPEVVSLAGFDRDNDDQTKSKSGQNYLTVQYEKLVPLLIEGIKELKAENDTLKEILQRNNIQ